MEDFSIMQPKDIHSPVYAAESSVQDVVGWMAVAIVVILIVGMLLYFLLIRGSLERDRQMALARVRTARGAGPARASRGADHYRQASSYDEGAAAIPDAVRAAYQDIGNGDESYDGYRHGGAGIAGGDEPYILDDDGNVPSMAGRVDRPPEMARRRPPADRTSRNLDILEDLLRPGGGTGETVRLEQEDRQLLYEESRQPETEEVSVEDDEVLFVDDEPESVDRGAGTAKAAPPAKDDFVTGPLALLLLQKDIENAVKDGSGKPKAGKGPAWSEGHPVFSKPLEAPTEGTAVRAAERPAPDMGEFSVQLRSLAEKKRAEARRLEDERRQRENRRAQEDAARREDASRKEETLRREIRGRVRAGISEAQQQAAPEGAPGVSPAEEEARRDEEQKKLEEDGRREERRRRWLELQKKHEVDTIEDVLSRIGIK
jgi:hypothetical protein